MNGAKAIGPVSITAVVLAMGALTKKYSSEKKDGTADGTDIPCIFDKQYKDVWEKECLEFYEKCEGTKEECDEELKACL